MRIQVNKEYKHTPAVFIIIVEPNIMPCISESHALYEVQETSTTRRPTREAASNSYTATIPARDRFTKKPKKVTVFISGGAGSYIRNAATGVYYNNVVGTADEDLFFTVSLSTGQAGPSGNKLFFTSPNEYLNHIGEDFVRGDGISPEALLRWSKKRQHAQANCVPSEI